MADPMRIRANMVDGKVEVKVLMAHEMETGQRKDSKGATIPAWFIQSVTPSGLFHSSCTSVAIVRPSFPQIMAGLEIPESRARPLEPEARPKPSPSSDQ